MGHTNSLQWHNASNGEGVWPACFLNAKQVTRISPCHFGVKRRKGEKVKRWKNGFTSQYSNSSSHQFAPSTRPLIYLFPHQLVLPSTRPLINSSSHQLVLPSTRPPVNSSSLQLILPSTHPLVNSSSRQLVPLSTSILVLSSIRFCLLFSNNFNIMSALVIHQTPTRPQKIDSREGWFWYKKGLVINAIKMNTHCIKPHLAPYFGLLGAKCSAFWC